ncbi:hypothetical protein GCM10009087_53590 [Sphingomonas oligophenolica]|uniref:SRPBCC domain-containing protein n=1 Tax=Sphingomonas oligophenolica TaxID=301154 RepID=A0ABU9Y7Q7_9SPHN
MSSQIESSIVIERVYQADVEELWDLWTTKEGFESWWGPRDFRADVHTLEARPGGALHYDMVADTPAMIAAMKNMGQPASHACRGSFTEFRPHERLVLTQLIDFLPGVEPYDSTMVVDFLPVADGRVRMVVTLSQMHDAQFTEMQKQGFTSQLSKLDKRYGWLARSQ